MGYSYAKNGNNILKYLNFIIGDILAMQIALLLAYISRNGIEAYNNYYLYKDMAVLVTIVYFCVLFFYQTYRKIYQRGYLEEFISTVSNCILISGVFMIYTFITQTGVHYSRIVVGLFTVYFILISYINRIVVKKIPVRKSKNERYSNSMLLITSKAYVEKLAQQVNSYKFHTVKINGLVVIDEDMVGKTIGGIPVISNRYGVKNYLLFNWVDEVFVLTSNDTYSEYFDDEIEEICNKIGVVLHKSLYSRPIENNLSVNSVFGYTVITHNVVNMSMRDAFIKRAMDIFGGLIGCIVTIILTIIIAPIIYISSPGSIFFSQNRVGRNGKVFKIYKFRSMYMDAEERKAELMKQNKVKDGMMFKMDDDPRIIKGIGHIIRKLSIDEFPQFFNVLKGEMSLVGTRPPTVDEWKKYDLHHKKRLAVKPGLTGMWQVSGRSNITDFEEVVELDTKYINNFSLKLDIKILFKTILVIFKREGSA